MGVPDHLKQFAFKPGDERFKTRNNDGAASFQRAASIARKILEDPTGLAKTVELYRAGKLPPPVWVALMHYSWGKPKDSVSMEVRQEGEALLALSDEEVIQRNHARVLLFAEKRRILAKREAEEAEKEQPVQRDALGVARVWPTTQ